MIHYYRHHSISAEFAGLGKPAVWRVRRLAANWVSANTLLDTYPTVRDAMKAIDSTVLSSLHPSARAELGGN